MSSHDAQGRPDSTARWLAPRDGGRGREVRRKWSCIRWFSWNYGTAWRRSHRTFWTLTWHLFSGGEVLFGLSTYKDDDGDRIVRLGFWPVHVEASWTPWARPDALGWRFGATDDG